VTYDLELLEKPHAIVRQIILKGLVDFNRAVLGSGQAAEDLAVVIRNRGSREILGGLWGRTSWDWLTIELVFVPESLRGQSLAARLVGMAEEEGLHRGCHSVWLDTLNPKALTLYERLGYERFGELKDFPKGGSRFFLQKKLAAAASQPRQSSDRTAQRS
jgi:GNAT superfamily N-acetyltransferase